MRITHYQRYSSALLSLALLSPGSLAASGEEPVIHLACAPPLPPATPPAPAPVPPNSARITATVHKHRVWLPGSLQGTQPYIPPEQTLYSLAVEIHTADEEKMELESFVQPGVILEAFSVDALSPDSWWAGTSRPSCRSPEIPVACAGASRTSKHYVISKCISKEKRRNAS